jgi:hypothetical protein
VDYAVTVTGIYKSKDAGYQWRPVNTGLPDTGLQDRPVKAGSLFLIADPGTPETLFVLLQQRSMYTSSNGGESWREIKTNLPDMEYTLFAIDPNNSSTFYVFSMVNGIYRSVDGARNWVPFNKGLNTYRINFVKFDPKYPLNLYAGTGGGLYTMHLSG